MLMVTRTTKRHASRIQVLCPVRRAGAFPSNSLHVMELSFAATAPKHNEPTLNNFSISLSHSATSSLWMRCKLCVDLLRDLCHRGGKTKRMSDECVRSHALE